MAKKKVIPPWAVGKDIAKKEATKSIKATTKESRGERKIIKVYEEAHRRAKFMAFEEGMKLTEFLEYIINEKWEQRDTK